MHPPLTILMRYCKRPFSVTTSKGLPFIIPKVGFLRHAYLSLAPHSTLALTMTLSQPALLFHTEVVTEVRRSLTLH